METATQPPVAQQVVPNLKADWRRGYQSQPQEFDYWLDEVEGTIPAELHGTLYRNGPGLLDVNGQPLQHPFDGDGYVCMFAFRSGRAFFRSRYVQTEGYCAERQAGTILYRGVFGTQKPGGVLQNVLDLRLKNVANTNVVHWGGRLWALWEAAQPYRIDPLTLATLGLDDLDGVLKPGQPFAAHLHIDPFCHWDGGAPCLVNFGVKPGPRSTISVYEFDPAGQLVREYAQTVPGFAFLHDMAITPNYVIFLQNPVRYNPLGYALGYRGAADCLEADLSRPSKILVIPRHSSLGRSRTLNTAPGFVWHHANAYEEGSELVIDSVWYETFPKLEGTDFRHVVFEALPPGRLARLRIDLASEATTLTTLDRRCSEFPVVHPAKVGRRHRYVYLTVADAPTGNAPLQAISRVDVETGAKQVWSAAPRGFCSEPIFVARPRSATVADRVTPDVGSPITNASEREDDGWLLTLVYNAATHRSALVIHDAADLERGPLATLHLRQHIPHGLHGSFTSTYFGPLD